MKIFHSCSNRGAWSIGTQLILKERGTEPPVSYESRNIQFIKENTTIPVPNIIADWEEDNGRYFMITKRIPDKSLSEVWSTMAGDDKKRIVKQTADYLNELRKLHSPRMESLGGEPLYCPLLFASEPRVPHGSFSSDDELWAELEKSLGDFSEKVRRRLRAKMPTAAPYTFTHDKLGVDNIMIQDGNVTGIIDWERAGYYPVWWETLKARPPHCREDKEFMELLLEHVPQYPGADEFYEDFSRLAHDYFEDSDYRRSVIERLEGEDEE